MAGGKRRAARQPAGLPGAQRLLTTPRNFQVITDSGIPASNIIVLAVDDIASAIGDFAAVFGWKPLITADVYDVAQIFAGTAGITLEALIENSWSSDIVGTPQISRILDLETSVLFRIDMCAHDKRHLLDDSACVMKPTLLIATS